MKKTYLSLNHYNKFKSKQFSRAYRQLVRNFNQESIRYFKVSLTKCFTYLDSKYRLASTIDNSIPRLYKNYLVAVDNNSDEAYDIINEIHNKLYNEFEFLMTEQQKNLISKMFKI